jgi:hypothetical protein
MYCTYRRPLVAAVRAIIHNVRILTAMVLVAGACGTFEMFGGVVRASESASESVSESASEMTAGCSAAGVVRRQLRVRLVPAKGVEAGMRGPVQEEVAELWRPYGVDIVWEDAWLENDTRPMPELFVFFVDRELQAKVGGGATAVAWIQFMDGSPGQLINASVAAARRLLNETRWLDERPIRMAPNNAQDRLIGTMIGRAIAHEIGHYLLASSKHAREGLMKPLITPAEFVRQGHKHLKLVPEDVRALHAARLANCQLTASR